MKKIAIFVLFMTLAAAATSAQETQDEERMFVMVTYVTIKQGMEQAFMATVADHLEWHKSTNDTHYFNSAQVITGPRTGQFVWSAGPMTGAMLDEYSVFLETDMEDWSGRGGMQYVDGTETHIYATLPGLGNPPPPGHQATMVNIFEIDVEFVELNTFMQAVTQLDALEAQIGYADYHVWTEVVSGDSFTKRHYVQWVDGWADMPELDMPGRDPARQAELATAAGGEEAYAELVENLSRGVKTATVHTIQNLPHLSFLPAGQ